MEEQDMVTPVTRGELREELGKLERRFDLKLETWGGALADRITKLEKRFEHLLYTELARHTNAILEALRGRVSVIDEKYADLPGRVARLERKVFASKRTPRR